MTYEGPERRDYGHLERKLDRVYSIVVSELGDDRTEGNVNTRMNNMKGQIEKLFHIIDGNGKIGMRDKQVDIEKSIVGMESMLNGLASSVARWTNLPCTENSEAIKTLKEHVQQGNKWRLALIGIVFAGIVQVVTFAYVWGGITEVVKRNSADIAVIKTHIEKGEHK